MKRPPEVLRRIVSGSLSMNGRKRSGKPGIVQAMQMPPTLGQPPTPFTQPRAGTLHFATGPAQPSFARQVPWSASVSAKRPCSASPARSHVSWAVCSNSQSGRP